MTVPRKTLKTIAFAAAAALLAALTVCAALLVLDLYLHHRAQRSAGLNRWGYRGAVAGPKGPGEFRVAVLGGSTAFGYGVLAAEAFPAQLERFLNSESTGRRYSVVNLAYNAEGAYSFQFTLADYAYLKYDLVCLYEGYNDLIGHGSSTNHAVYRHTSPIFRLTGYFPILPLVLREKAMALRHGGNVGSAYEPGQAGQTVFRPGVAARMTASALDAAAAVGASLEHQVGKVAAERRHESALSDGCGGTWSEYCDSVAKGVAVALAHGSRVLFVTQPLLNGDATHFSQIEQQAATVQMLRERFGATGRVFYANLGHAIDLRDIRFSFDGMHLTPEGNVEIARALAPRVASIADGGGAWDQADAR